MNKWEIKKVRYGEEGKLLNEGWEPFSTSVEQGSYYYLNTSVNHQEQQITNQTYIYLRKLVNSTNT